MSTDDKPKSAVELAMERMRRKDADSGVAERPPRRTQKAADRRGTQPSRVESGRSRDSAPIETGRARSIPQIASQAEEAYRRDLARLHDDLERKIAKMRSRGGLISCLHLEAMCYHIFLVTLNTEFHVSRCPHRLPTSTTGCLEARHVLCNVGSGLGTYACNTLQEDTHVATIRNPGPCWCIVF